MAGEPPFTVVGNLTADPELRFTPSGAAVVNFSIASTPRSFDRQANEFRDGETLYVRCSAWREMAENVANSLTKGTRVIAHGHLKAKAFETKEGEKRTSWELDVEAVGPDLRFASAVVQRGGAAQPQGFSQPAPSGGQPQGYGASPLADQGWGSQEPPF